MKKQKEKCDYFTDEFPKIALAVNLDCEMKTANDSSNSPNSLYPGHIQCHQMKKGKTWLQVAKCYEAIP